MSEIVAIITSIVMAIAASVGLYTIHLTSRHFKQKSLYDALEQINQHQEELNRVLGLEEKPYDHWSDEDKQCANTIIVDLFHIGGLVKADALSKDFCELYYYTIPKIWLICHEYIKDMRARRHPSYWKKFEELVEITKKHNKGTEFEL